MTQYGADIIELFVDQVLAPVDICKVSKKIIVHWTIDLFSICNYLRLGKQYFQMEQPCIA